MDLQRRIDDQLLKRVQPTGVGDPRGAISNVSSFGALAGVSNYIYCPWFDPAWRYRALIALPRLTVTTDETNMPVYINGTGMPAELWTAAQADGDDLLITKLDGATQVAHDLPEFVPGSSNLELHFLADTIAALDDNYWWLYWGNSASGDQRNAAAVWADYEAVLHLHEAAAGTGTAGVYIDRTGNGHDGADYVSPGDKTGKLSATGGEGFDGGDRIELAADFTFGNFALSFWLRLNAIQTAGWKTFVGATAAPDTWEMDRQDTDNTINAVSQGGLTSSYALTVGVWYNVVLTREAGVGSKLYLNGVLDASNGSVATIAATALSLCSWQGAQYAVCSMDEFRAIGGVLTPAQVKAQYDNQATPGSFYTVGPAQQLMAPALLFDTAGHGLDQGFMR